jgi:hypothetical protein
MCHIELKVVTCFKIVSMNDLKRMFLLQELQLVDLTRDVENGTADGYIRIPSETSVIGVQVTRANLNSDGCGVYQIKKSKQSIVKQVLFSVFFFLILRTQRLDHVLLHLYGGGGPLWAASGEKV